MMYVCMYVCLCVCYKCVLDRCIAMLGRSFVRLSIASLAFQIKTKLNTSWAASLVVVVLAVLPARQRLLLMLLLSSYLFVAKSNCDARFWSFAFYTSTHSPSAIYDKHTHTDLHYIPVSMYVFVCVMLCLFFVTVQYFDMFCFYFGLQQQQQFAWPSTLQQSTAWLLSLSLAQLCSLLMISLFGIRCAVLNLRYQIALLAKNTKRQTDKRQKSQKKSS